MVTPGVSCLAGDRVVHDARRRSCWCVLLPCCVRASSRRQWVSQHAVCVCEMCNTCWIATAGSFSCVRPRDWVWIWTRRHLARPGARRSARRRLVSSEPSSARTSHQREVTIWWVVFRPVRRVLVDRDQKSMHAPLCAVYLPCRDGSKWQACYA
jgi:hypothetical protein